MPLAIAGRKAQLPEPAFQFSDFVRWQRLWSASGAANRQFAYWKERLQKVSPLFAPPKMQRWRRADLARRPATISNIE